MPACEEQRTSIFDEFRSQHRQCAEAAANLVVVADSDFGFRPRWDFGLFGASCERGTRELVTRSYTRRLTRAKVTFGCGHGSDSGKCRVDLVSQSLAPATILSLDACAAPRRNPIPQSSQKGTTNQGMHAVQLHVGALTRSANRGTCSMQTDPRVVMSHILSAVAIIMREPVQHAGCRLLGRFATPVGRMPG